MQAGLKQFSGFISEMNERTQSSDAHALARWGARTLSETIGFDCAWYGWAQLKEEGVQIYAQSAHNLPDNYYDSWCAMSEQDLLAAAMHENPDKAAVYDRFGNTQTDGMITLADTYGLNKMATAMQSRPGRAASFYLSSYRSGRNSRTWSQVELDFLQCAVDQLSSAMSLSVDSATTHGSEEHSVLVATDGTGVLGVNKARKRFGSLWPEWRNDQLPQQLCNLISLNGEHVLVDRQLVVTCENNTVTSDMDLRKLTLRSLHKFDLLTEREKEVARLLAQGMSHKEVARQLTVAPATVRNQTQSIYSKLHVNSRAALASAVNTQS